MKKQIKMMGAALAAVGGLAGLAQAELGMGFGAAFKYDADFSSAVDVQSRSTNPGTDVAGTDHFYDDGFVRVGSMGSGVGLTTYWGYDDASQYDPSGNGSITLSSARTTLDATGDSTVNGDARQPVMRIYWQHDFSEKEGRYYGFRSALRWQQIKVDGRVEINTTIDTITDVYAGPGPGWVPLPAGVDGTFTGPNAMITDSPARTISSAAGSTLFAERKLEADLLALDLGPTASFDLSEKVRVVASAGGTIGWVQGDFSYADSTYAHGSDSDSTFTYGLYASLDLQFDLGERWGLFAGVSGNYLDGVEFVADDRSAELDLGGCSFSGGIFFR